MARLFIAAPSVALLALHNAVPAVANGQDLSVLGENSWAPFRPGWSLTVNDQCLYEFTFAFQHWEELPRGDPGFEDRCYIGADRQPVVAKDGKEYLATRSFWEQFPDYVWATVGFNHLSIDWHACGERPAGYTLPHYGFSFFRTTPEFRAHTMTCDLQTTNIPGEQVCASRQDTPEGMGFFIVPGALVNRDPVVNMPMQFTHPSEGYGPKPYYGLRTWDPNIVLENPNEWEEVELSMSSYQGDLVMWRPLVPYKMVSGAEQSRFTSGRAQYFESTIETLPDTYSFHYDVKTGRSTFTMLGLAQICRDEFERAQEGAGGAPLFPANPSPDDGPVGNKTSEGSAVANDRVSWLLSLVAATTGLSAMVGLF